MEHSHDHDHEHGHDHAHEVDPMDLALEPPAEQLLAALRNQWVNDQQLRANLEEQLLVAKCTVHFQNDVIRQLQAQIQQLAGGTIEP